ncbi:MAG: hypothetical protein KA885_12045 [Spirochaetes bacterium]|nr:hypothetical protein [Spirochaetota bacterium]
MKRIVLIITFIILSVLVYAQQINYKIDFIQTSKNNDYSRYYKDLQNCLIGALKIVLNELEIQKDLDINILIEIADSYKYPNIKGVGAQSEEFVLLKKTNEGNVYQQGLTDYIFNEDSHLSKQHHFQIIINDKYLDKQLWFDPNPEKRTLEVPEKKLDAISVFMHEILHVLAFNGWLDSKTGISKSPNKARSIYDTHVIKYQDKLYFNGSNAVKIFGKMVPLNIRNYKHYGNSDNKGKILESFIMYGEFYKRGYRFNLSDLNLAILKDCGLNIKKK